MVDHGSNARRVRGLHLEFWRRTRTWKRTLHDVRFSMRRRFTWHVEPRHACRHECRSMRLDVQPASGRDGMFWWVTFEDRSHDARSYVSYSIAAPVGALLAHFPLLCVQAGVVPAPFGLRAPRIAPCAQYGSCWLWHDDDAGWSFGPPPGG